MQIQVETIIMLKSKPLIICYFRVIINTETGVGIRDGKLRFARLKQDRLLGFDLETEEGSHFVTDDDLRNNPVYKLVSLILMQMIKIKI